MNHQRNPRPGLERPLPLPLDHLLTPPDAFLRNGPIVRRGTAARNGRNTARMSGNVWMKRAISATNPGCKLGVCTNSGHWRDRGVALPPSRHDACEAT